MHDEYSSTENEIQPFTIRRQDLLDTVDESPSFMEGADEALDEDAASSKPIFASHRKVYYLDN